MTVSGHDKVGNLMLKLTAGLKPFVETQLKAVYKDDWTEYAKAEWRDGALRWDISTLFSTILEQWNPVFSHSLRLADRSLIHELREWRNRWAHQESMTTDDTYRAYDSAERLLAAIGSPLAATVKQQKQEVLRIIHEEEQVRFQQEQETEAREQRERVQRQQMLKTLLPVYLSNPQSDIIQATLAILQREHSLKKVTEAEITDYFKHMFDSINGRLESGGTRISHRQSPKSIRSTTPTDGGIEEHGQQRVIEALETAGYKAVLFSRNVLRVQSDANTVPSSLRFIRVISAVEESFRISKKYEDKENELLAFVWYARDPIQATIYAMTFEEALEIGDKKRWTATNSWQIEGAYSTTKPDGTLRDYLKPYCMTPDKWRIMLRK